MYYTTNFVIDLSKVDVSDITVDGVIYHCQACPSSLIYINKENGKICTKAETNSSEIFDVYKLKRQYSKSFSKTLKEHILQRTIVKFEADSGKLCKYAVIKYNSCSETENMYSDSGTFQQPHGIVASKFVASKLKNQAKENCLIYGSDREFALDKSLEQIFPIEDVVTGKTSIHLRCFDHVKTDIERFLSDRNVQISDRERIVKEFLESEYRDTR